MGTVRHGYVEKNSSSGRIELKERLWNNNKKNEFPPQNEFKRPVKVSRKKTNKLGISHCLIVGRRLGNTSYDVLLLKHVH